ncbi:MAG: DUF433 domain-containing protein [Nocardioides sp.]|uniref:DUF433 domain-containing protein n=1 Tax=Nocardioides sp. TaxID=35761 RepID=UPI0039E4DBFB
MDPLICHGAPTVGGMRIRVQDVLEPLASGMTYEEILADCDELRPRPRLDGPTPCERAPRPYWVRGRGTTRA